MSVRVLFMADHLPDRAPSQRYRYEQYLPYLRAQGITCDVSPLLSVRDREIFYRSGALWDKAQLAARAVDQRRLESGSHYLERYDVVFVHRGALFFGPPWVERRIAKSATRLVFDFDDAIWIHGVSEGNRLLGRLKFSDKVREICRLADVVVGGNEYLTDFAREQGAARAEVIPTTIDTDVYTAAPTRPDDAPVTIGWTGSFSTIPHFERALPALREIAARYGDRVRFKLIGVPDYRCDDIGLQVVPWQSATEVSDLHELDIGFMSLPDDEWTKGKCAAKGLQYMAASIATVMSPVGVNPEVISHGENGLLASTHEEWVRAFASLVENAKLRRRLGAAGRTTIVERYSVLSQRDRYVELLRSLA